MKDTPLLNPDLELFTNGSSFMSDSKRCAGCAAVQKAELIALIRVLTICIGRRVNMHIDSKCAFGVAHSHEAKETSHFKTHFTSNSEPHLLG